jgi:hypothetical protein
LSEEISGELVTLSVDVGTVTPRVYGEEAKGTGNIPLRFAPK